RTTQKRNKPEPGSRVIGHHSWKQPVTNGEFPSSPSLSFHISPPFSSSSPLSLFTPHSSNLSLSPSLFFSAAAQIFPVLTLLDPDSPPFYVGKTHKKCKSQRSQK
ncbi:unnamed protein product, partial [Brassica oleracea]